MADHFRLRPAKEVDVLISSKVSLAEKIIHVVSLLSVFSASAAVGVSFLEYAQHPYFKQSNEAFSQKVERPETATTDKYGGFKKVTGQATGTWHLETINEKNTFVDPLGNAFAMIGAVKVRRGNYDDAAYRAQYAGRNSQWARETSLFLANTLGMNTIADRSEHTEFQKLFVQQMPYMVLANFLSQEAPREETEWPDPWSADYLTKVRTESATLSRLYGRDPYLVAIKPFNETNINLRNPDGTQNPWADWWHVLINPVYGHTDAQAKWIEFMTARYNNDIATLNEVYGTSLTSFSELEPLGLDLFDKFEEITEEEEPAADIAFADTVYWTADFYGEANRVIAEELKAVMPNVLISSEGFRNGIVEYPILQAIGPYTDFTILNYYVSAEEGTPNKDYINSYAVPSGNPVLIGEFSFTGDPCSVSDDGATYPHVATQADRTEAYLKYRNAALLIPSVIGVNWNELVDAPIHDESREYDCTYVNFGFQDRQLQPYTEMITAGGDDWFNFDTIKWSEVTIQGDMPSAFGPVHLTPINPRKKQRFSVDPVVNTGADRMKWYKIDPLNPDAEPPFTMPGPDVIEMMYGKSLESPQS